VEAALSAAGRRLVAVDEGEVDDDLARDMAEVLTSFCARLHGRRGARNRAVKALRCAAHDVGPMALSNPTSNGIYQDIGYRPDHDAKSGPMCLLTSRPRPVAEASEAPHRARWQRRCRKGIPVRSSA